MPRPFLRSLAGALLFCAWMSQPARAFIQVPPQPTDGYYLNDAAGLLTPDELRQLRMLADETRSAFGVELVLSTTPILSGLPKEVAVATLDKWQPGSRSVLLLISVEPRELFIMPGAAMESRFDTRWTSSTCRDVIAPGMKTGHSFWAISAGLTAIRDRAIGPEPPPWTARIPWTTVLLGAVGLLGLGGAIAFSRLRDPRRRCPKCRERMNDTIRAFVAPTHTRRGRRKHFYQCTGCAHAFVETENLGRLDDSGSDADGVDFSADSSDSSDGIGGGSDW